jgi:sortase A
MNPDTRSPGGDLPDQPKTDSSPTPSPTPQSNNSQDAAANVIRSRLDAIYGGTSNTPETKSIQPEPHHVAPIQGDSNPYHRTHTEHPLPQADQWKEYHTAWQTYYQKYYEQYYTKQHKQPEYFNKGNTKTEAPAPSEVSQDEALFELRQKLLGKVRKSAGSIRKSRHFVPIIAATLVVLLFVFVQFNRTFIAGVQAYISPGAIDPQNIVIDPAADLQVSPEPRLIIPKINVDVPVVYDVSPDQASQLEAMEKGVAHFPIPGANSKPGQVGNTVLSGHSSNDIFDQGDYKFIFAQLEKLQVGDTLYANYEGTRYTYVITKKEVVRPTEVQKLVYPTDKPVMTLITCTPLGTAIDRLLVTAEQVSPDPLDADEAPSGSGTETVDAVIPGNSPTFVERLFGVGR